MTQRLLACLLIGIITLLLGVMMAGQKLLFHYGNRNFTGDIKSAMASAEAGDWATAEQSAHHAAQLWNQGNFLVAVKYAESDYSLLNIFLARFQAAIIKRDANTVQSGGASCLYLFNNITSPAPQP